MPISLSGGEQQRLAIARAIACRPSILLADEPTGNLDKKYADEIMSLFYSFQELGVTVIIATHEMPIVSKKHKQLYLQDGNLIKITEQ
jgi:cell division transport system ATP-binding protein